MSGDRPILGESALQLDRLSDLETVIDRGLTTFIEVGQALVEIREQRYYRLIGFETFDAYCGERWGWTRRHADRMIEAAEVVAMIAVEREAGLEMRPMGLISESGHRPAPPLPVNERQTRELARLKEPVAMHEVWRDAVDERGEHVTAAYLHDRVEERLGVRQETRERRERELRARDAILDLVGDPQGHIEQARLAATCVDAITRIRKLLSAVDPDASVPLLDQDERRILRELVRDVRTWASSIEAELGRPLRMVSSNDDV